MLFFPLGPTVLRVQWRSLYGCHVFTTFFDPVLGAMMKQVRWHSKCSTVHRSWPKALSRIKNVLWQNIVTAQNKALFFDPDDGTNSFPDMIGLDGAECQRQGRTATGENLSHVHCKIPATRGAKVLSLGLKENKHDVLSFSENLLLCSPFFLYLHFGCQILDPAR